MRIVLVGADFEENLGVGMIAATARQAGHRVSVLPFQAACEGAALARRVADLQPDVVGLSMQFEHRASEFLALARSIRERGYRGALVCGGEYATLDDVTVLAPRNGVDAVVLHEGERTFVELLAALQAGLSPVDIPGLALRGAGGEVVRTPGRPLDDDLDALPWPARYRAHSLHLGVPFIPVLGGRGCWGRCRFCSISAFNHQARARAAGGRLLRLRSPDSVAGELATLTRAAGGRAIACFHDDNFLLPRPADSLARVRAIRAGIEARGAGQVVFVGKARPDCVTPALLGELRALGVIRLYVGVENASAPGAAHLGRAATPRAAGLALDACRDAGIFSCYNLLLFEPGATLADVAENIAFVRAHAEHPVNFCRAEAYAGTALARESSGLSRGAHGRNYRIADDRAELLFRISAAAFRERNFAPAGVANRYMGLGYSARILEAFHATGDRAGVASLARRAAELTRAISLDTASLLEEALDLAGRLDPGDRDRIERETALLGLRVAAADRVWHAAMDELHADMNELAEVSMRRQAAAVRPASRLAQAARRLALGASLGLTAAAAAGCDDEMVVDPVPPPDACCIDGGPDAMVVDPAPPDASIDSMVVDPVPIDAAIDGAVVDPAPIDASGPVDPPPIGLDAAFSRAWLPGDRWQDTAPLAARTPDLPLHLPPVPSLSATRAPDGRLAVSLQGVGPTASTRWEGDGRIEGSGHAVTWAPAGPSDQLRVAVRTHGGVAVVTLRAREV